MSTAVIAILVIAFIGIAWLLLRTREANARLAEAARRLEDENAGAKQDQGELKEFGEVLKQVENAVEKYKEREDARDKEVDKMLASVAESSGRVVQRVDALVGRWANPKQRGQLSEEWLVAALRQMNLRDDVHFEVQKHVEIEAARGTKNGVIDVFLLLPNSQ